MNGLLEKKYSYLSKFFASAIEQKRLFHSLIFYGSNNLIQYAMALELARKLNCLEDGRENCNCQNCRWIRENKHPAVMTVSKIDNKNDDAKTVISAKQIETVLDTLYNSSDYHRVFIFCDAEFKKLSDEEKLVYDEFLETGFSPAQENIEDKYWFPSGLNHDCYSDVVADAMLKSIEEPPENVTFIFLTNNKDDLISTVVSRSQVFGFPDTKDVTYRVDFFERYFSNYPDFTNFDAFDFAQCLYDFQANNDCESYYVIDCIQYYLTQLMKSNYDNHILMNIIFKDIEKLEEAKKMLNSYIKEQTVYENLAFYFAKR
ncbi:hypothetical protein II906_13260 [bacterium]|nr:hypothetical protein [bacterium]